MCDEAQKTVEVARTEDEKLVVVVRAEVARIQLQVKAQAEAREQMSKILYVSLCLVMPNR